MLPTVLLASSMAASATAIYTIGDQIFTANPTAISVAGITITAGGPGLTFDGEVVSLQASGGLVVDGSTVAVPSANQSASATNVVFTGNASGKGGRFLWYIVTTIAVTYCALTIL